MSTIKTTTLSTQGGSTVPVDTVVNGTAKAWVNFNGTGTVAIRRAFNVSSITDNGTGDYSVNFTTAMADANYCVNITYGNSGSNLQLRSIIRGTTTEQRFFVTANGTNSGSDTAENSVSIFS